MKHIKKFNENMYDQHMRDEQENDPNWGKPKNGKGKDYIITKFKQRFAGKNFEDPEGFNRSMVDAQEFAELYHDLRTEGVDGILIFDTLEEAGLYSGE
jgi:hypothetical protein